MEARPHSDTVTVQDEGKVGVVAVGGDCVEVGLEQVASDGGVAVVDVGSVQVCAWGWPVFGV